MNDFKDLILSPLYEEVSFSLLRNDEGTFILKDDFARFLKLINIEKFNIKGIFCDKCDTEMSFKVSSNVRLSNATDLNLSVLINGSRYISTRSYELYNENRCFIEIELTCNHDNNHIYLFIFELNVVKDKLILRKIGQTPENYVIDNYEEYGFNEELKRFGIKNDFKNIHVMLSNRHHVCSLLYMRRTLEKIINKLISNIQESTLDESSNFKEKFDFLKSSSDELSHDIIDITGIVYKLSSISIHQLEDNEASEYTKPIYEFIIHQLTYMKNKNEAKKKIDEAKRTLERFSSQRN